MLYSFHGSVNCRNTTTNSFFCVRFGYGANAIIAVGRVAAFCSPWSISTTDGCGLGCAVWRTRRRRECNARKLRQPAKSSPNHPALENCLKTAATCRKQIQSTHTCKSSYNRHTVAKEVLLTCHNCKSSYNQPALEKTIGDRRNAVLWSSRGEDEKIL